MAKTLITDRKRVILLIFIMAIVSISVAWAAILILYDFSVEQQSARLAELAQSQGLFLEAVARFDAGNIDKDSSGNSFALTLSQIRDAHERFKGFEKTIEFTLAKREGDQIVFLLSRRHLDPIDQKPVPFFSNIAEPMRRALSGESGSAIAMDYHGERVLAAYEPVDIEGMIVGIVAKMDLAEVRSPFIKAGLIAEGIAFLFVIIGVFLFLWVSNPLIRHLEESEKNSAIYMRLFLYLSGKKIFLKYKIPSIN